jgi:putative ABC transport system permease protein
MLSDLWIRVRALFRRKSVETEMEEELRFHLERQVEKYVKSGMSRAEAQRRARVEFGGVELTKEECRDARGVRFVEGLFQDARYGARMLRKSPGFTTVAILTLALGIGASTGAFSILESQLWHPLPFPDSERLVDVHVALRQNVKRWDPLPGGVLHAWREQSRSFMNVAAYVYPSYRNSGASGTSERVIVMAVTSNFLDTLGVAIAQGRGFLIEEETPGQDHVAIISHSLWQERFAADSNLLGRSITVDGEAYTVIGIVPSGLRLEYMDEPAILVPLATTKSRPVIRGLYAIGRLAPNATQEQAREELTAILDREMKSEGLQPEDVATVTNLRELWTGFARRPLYFFGGTVALVLLIACVNTAGLLLARGIGRKREMAVRAALGAGRGKLMRQLLVESLMLALAGGAGGALAGMWLARWLSTVVPVETLPRHAPVVLNAQVLLFTLAVSLVSAVLAGLAPAVFASRSDLNDTLRLSAPGKSPSRSQRNARGSLVAIEVALSQILLFGAGLFLASFLRLQEAPRGFEAPGSLTFRVALRGANYAQPDQLRRYFDRFMEQLRSLSGVRTVTLGSGLPLGSESSLYANVRIAGHPSLSSEGSVVFVYSIAPNYFEALRMHLLAGRAFSGQDIESSPRVAILNRNLARGLFGDENPLGKTLEFVSDQRRGMPAEAPVEIIGVAENAQVFGADEVPQDILFVPFLQHPVPAAYLLVASDLPRGPIAQAIRATAYAIDKDQPVFDVRTMDDRVTDSLRGARFNLLLVGALAAVAVVLVSVGTFSMVVYFVQQRTQEFGIRLALGATPGRILRHAVTQAGLIGATGLSTGVIASLILGRLLRHALYLVPHEHMGMLFGVKIYDPFIMGGASALLIVVLLLASYVPGRRATKVDPMVALRYE